MAASECFGAAIHNHHDRLQKLTFWREWLQAEVKYAMRKK